MVRLLEFENLMFKISPHPIFLLTAMIHVNLLKLLLYCVLYAKDYGLSQASFTRLHKELDLTDIEWISVLFC